MNVASDDNAAASFIEVSTHDIVLDTMSIQIRFQTRSL